MTSTNQQGSINLDVQNTKYRLDFKSKTLRIYDYWISEENNQPQICWKSFVVPTKGKSCEFLTEFCEDLALKGRGPKETIRVPAGNQSSYIWKKDGRVYYESVDGTKKVINRYVKKTEIIRSIIKKLCHGAG